MEDRKRESREDLPNLEQTPNEQARAGRQEVGTPHGRAQASEILRPGPGVYKLGEEEAETCPSYPIPIAPPLNLQLEKIAKHHPKPAQVELDQD